MNNAIEFFRIVKGVRKVDSTKFLSISGNNRKRGNSYKLESMQCNTTIRSFFLVRNQ